MAKPITYTPTITMELANALGASRATRAVLTLEVGELPRLDLTYLASGRSIAANILPDDAAARIARTPLKLRLYAHPLNEEGTPQ